MHRDAIELLYKWKQNKYRKPLLMRGARQVGKTWLMREFGKQAYSKIVYINFDNNPQMQALFSIDLNMERIVTGLELYAGHKINPADTLLIFDEVQEVPLALSSLKYFNEFAPQYQIVCAGSLLGVALHPGTSFPVGKVEFLDLYPLSFTEFLKAVGKEQFVELLEKGDFAMASTFKQEYVDALKHYYYLGGMPEVVQHFVWNKDFNEAREIQQRILDAYEQDFSKHAPNGEIPRIRMLWNSIPVQLAKENKKFIYGLIKEGARAKDYELSLMWLIDCGLVHQLKRVSAPRIPLKAYEDLRAFKLFLLDVGLLSCMVRLKPTILLEGNRLFQEFKGALTEAYVLQQLKTLPGIESYYWTNDRGSAELDFLLDTGDRVIPLEVKAEINLKAKSLKTFCEKYGSQSAIRTSMSDYRQEEWVLNLPLWAIGTIKEQL
ncbi:ATP-binding protein [Spirochaetota bacterium]